MGQRLNNLETLTRLHRIVDDSTLIERVSPLFSPGTHPAPQRISEFETQTQLSWEQEGYGRFEHERLVITLGTNGLTIAIAHRHDHEAGDAHPFTTASVDINPDRHHLIITDQARRGEQHHYNHRATVEFLPRLNHTLGVLNLGHQAVNRRWAS